MEEFLPRLAPFQNKSLVERFDKDNTWGSADGTSLNGRFLCSLVNDNSKPLPLR